MSETNQERLHQLEKENKLLREATARWEQIQKLYNESNEQLQRSEQALAEAKQRTDLALDAGDLAWWDWDYKTGRIQYNENRAKLLGLTLDEMPYSFGEITQMIHPDDYNATMKNLNKHLTGEAPYYLAEFRLKTKRGEWKWFSDKGKIVEKDILGNPLRLAGVLIDIDHKKVQENQLQEALDKALADGRSKSLFLASMSHEIYTPMAGVIGMAQILKQSKLSQEQEEYLDAIVKSATNLMSILNDILEFSKLEGGKVEFHEKPFSVTQVVEEIAASVVDKAGEKRLEVLSFQDPNIPAEVVGDPVRLRQVLKIFTDNAVKFTEKGTITIKSEFMEWDEESVKIKFTIADTGIGIRKEEMDKLFSSFSKIGAPKQGSLCGGGLGLAIAKRLIDRVDGVISVESTPGEGTTFAVTIVFDRYKDSEVADPMKAALGGMKVLLLDPLQSHRSIARNYFERWDCEVEESTNPEEALKLIQHQAGIKSPFKLILIGNAWEQGDGLAIGRMLKNDQAIGKTKLLLTAERDYSLPKSELEEAGFSGILNQPFTIHRLRNRLLDAIGRGEKPEPEIKEPLSAEIKKKILSILLAEDNQINQKVALVTLDRIGHKVDLAENGRIAVDMFKERVYDLVLMDIYMPEMDGLEATRNIRDFEAMHPERKPVFICAITANTTREDEERCINAGMNGFISKPFRMDELIHLLNKL